MRESLSPLNDWFEENRTPSRLRTQPPIVALIGLPFQAKLHPESAGRRKRDSATSRLVGLRPGLVLDLLKTAADLLIRQAESRMVQIDTDETMSSNGASGELRES